MNTREQDLEKVRALKHNDSCYIAWCDGGGGEVHRVWDMLFLFEIPQYGGEGLYEKAFHITWAEQLVDLAHTWA